MAAATCTAATALAVTVLYQSASGIEQYIAGSPVDLRQRGSRFPVLPAGKLQPRRIVVLLPGRDAAEDA